MPQRLSPKSKSSIPWISDLKCNAQFTGSFPSKGNGLFRGVDASDCPTPVGRAISRCAPAPCRHLKQSQACGLLPSPPGIRLIEGGYAVEKFFSL
jgi:hypothetical protein